VKDIRCSLEKAQGKKGRYEHDRLVGAGSDLRVEGSRVMPQYLQEYEASAQSLKKARTYFAYVGQDGKHIVLKLTANTSLRLATTGTSITGLDHDAKLAQVAQLDFNQLEAFAHFMGQTSTNSS